MPRRKNSELFPCVLDDIFFKVSLFQETFPALKRPPLRMGTLCIYLDLILYKYYWFTSSIFNC